MRERKSGKLMISIVRSFIVTCMFTVFVSVSAFAATESSVDATITADQKVLSFGDKSRVEINLNTVFGQGGKVILPTDIVLIIDKSGSMGGNNIMYAKEAARTFVNMLDTDIHSVAVMGYSSNVDSVPTSDFDLPKEEIYKKISSLSAGGNTNTSSAVDAAVTLLKSRNNKRVKTIILLTDGNPNEFDKVYSDAYEACVAVSEAAKNEGVIFYTVGLGISEGSNTLQETTLKTMASSGNHDFYTPYPSQLVAIYKNIEEDIGEPGVYKVKISQTVNSNLSIVPGSADDNVPPPTIKGNTITWDMSSLAEGETSLHYEVTPIEKAKSGTYDVASLSATYCLYTGKKKTIKTTLPKVQIIGTPVFTPSILSSMEGKPTVETVSISNFEYDTDFAVKFGSKDVTTSNARTSFKFDIPTDVTPGHYFIKVINGGKTYTVGTYNVTAMPTPVFGEMIPASSMVRKSQLVSVVQENLEYAKDAKITFGNIEVPLKSKGKKSFTFNVPTTADITPGNYSVKLINNGKTYTIGTYKVEPEPNYEFSMTPDSSVKNVAQIVTVLKDERMDYGSDARVLIAGKSLRPGKKKNDSFTFSIPTNLEVGAYDVEFINNGNTYSIGKYNVLPKPKQEPTLTLTPDSGIEKKDVMVTVQKKNFDVGSDAYVIVDGDRELKITKVLNNYFKFVMPSDMSVGSHTVSVYSEGFIYPVGTYTVIELVPTLTLSKTSNNAGTKTTVTVKTSNLTYDNLKAYLDDEEMRVCKIAGSYFRFIVPATQTRGSYNVKVVCGGKTYDLGEYVVK